MILLSLLACWGNGTGKAGDIVLTDANNYAFTADLGIESTDVEIGEDFTIDWSGLTTDMLGHEMDPTEIDTAWFMWFRNLDQATLAEGLAANTVTQVDVDWAASAAVSGETSVDTSLLDFGGNPYDAPTYFSQDQGAYLLRVTSGSSQTADTRMLAFVHPSSQSTNHTVTLGNSSSTLAVDVDLSSLSVVSVSDGATPAIDWSEVATDGLGAPVDWNDVSELWIARFDGKSVADLEAEFLDLELIYDGLYTAQMFGETGLASTAAVDGSGAAFPGFTAGSTWLLALRCPDYCTSPAPPFLTVVSVE